MFTVKIVMYDGEVVIIRNCQTYSCNAEDKIIIVFKNNHNNVFNMEFVQYIGYLEDLEEGEADE